MTRLDVLPSAICTASAPGIGLFRGSMAGLCAPLSTLRRDPRGQLRKTRGRCGSLILHRKRLALSTPCRSPSASQIQSAMPHCPDLDAACGHFADGPETVIVPCEGADTSQLLFATFCECYLQQPLLFLNATMKP